MSQQTKERTSFYSYEIQLVFKTMDLVETLSNFVKMYQSIVASRNSQVHVQELAGEDSKKYHDFV